MARGKPGELLCLLADPIITPGSPPPKSYEAWHLWARAQRRAGLRQVKCPNCGLWVFPQEVVAHETEKVGG